MAISDMIDENGNIRRYVDSDVVDEFKPGQMADVSFPRGYNKGNRVYDVCPSINPTTVTRFLYKETFGMRRIRKITPRECYRLMGFKDAEFDRAKSVCSDTQLYKQAGNSVVVSVAEGIFKNMEKYFEK